MHCGTESHEQTMPTDRKQPVHDNVARHAIRLRHGDSGNLVHEGVARMSSAVNCQEPREAAHFTARVLRLVVGV